jgi:hypothetical protein
MQIRYTLNFIVLIATMVITIACNGSSSNNAKETNVTSNKQCPVFVADSAFRYIEEQCAFGPRLLGTDEADQCAEWIKAKFAENGCTVGEQCTEVVVWDGKKMPCRNIIACTNMEATQRIMLCAHWDTRPWADNDADESNHRTPVLGANDGASGVAVMLEIARQIKQYPLEGIGIDFICFDAEDMGTPEWAEPIENGEDTWCLGSKVWAEKALRDGYRPRYGILLDMVGGRGATFAREQVSVYFANHIVKKVWALASDLGYGQFFPYKDGGSLVDDHVNVNTIARIPCIDIVPYFADGPSSFGPTWHTVHDTPENIDKNVLKAVGQTVLQLIYNEQ